MNMTDEAKSGIEVDSYCGLYCGACEILVAYLEAEKQGTTARWDDLPIEMTSMIPEAEVRCHGCKSDIVFAGCRRCPMRSCARDKQVDFCIECEEYPCSLIDEMKAAIEKIKDAMPHATSIINNLEDIKKLGKDAWLQKQKEIWSCPACGARLSWYQSTCRQCEH
jgi:hypothetical protein